MTHAPAVMALNAAGFVAAGGALVRATRRHESSIAWTGTLAAFVFVAQAVNLPILPGASAHIIGTALLTAALGPARAIVAMVAVLVVQALLLADGGITVLGINILTIGVLPALVVAGTLRLARGRARFLSRVTATVAGNVSGAALLGAALIHGAGAPPALTMGWLLGVGLAASVGEGILTAVALSHLERRAPSLVWDVNPAERDAPTFAPQTRKAFFAVAIALGLFLAMVPLSSSAPDALESLVERLGKLP